MAITEIYVDPAINADTGDGSIETPYGDTEYAIIQETFDLTNGSRVNVKQGTDEMLVAPITDALADTSVSIAWAPSTAAPFIIQGYTAVANDGGIGGLNGGGSVGCFGGDTLDWSAIVDLHCHNTGSANVIDIDNSNLILRVEVDNTTGAGIEVDNYNRIHGCYIHNVGGSGVITVTGSYFSHNVFVNDGQEMVWAMSIGGSGATAYRNLIVVDGATRGINLAAGGRAVHNAIYSVGGTEAGITGTGVVMEISNNLIEGFSGSGGRAFDLNGASTYVQHFEGNSIFNNATDIEEAGAVAIWRALYPNKSYEVLDASPFTDAGSNNFAPVDIGNVKEGALPFTFGNGAI